MLGIFAFSGVISGYPEFSLATSLLFYLPCSDRSGFWRKPDLLRKFRQAECAFDPLAVYFDTK
jgi:hypothetical protein